MAGRHRRVKRAAWWTVTEVLLVLLALSGTCFVSAGYLLSTMYT